MELRSRGGLEGSECWDGREGNVREGEQRELVRNVRLPKEHLVNLNHRQRSSQQCDRSSHNVLHLALGRVSGRP